MNTHPYFTPFCILVLIFACMLTPGCGASSAPHTKHVHQNPSYKHITIKTGDTISFPLSEHHYNNISASNFFVSNGRSFVSFYDKGSKSVLVYDFNTRELVKASPLINWVRKTKLDKASMYFINFDSIFVTTQESLYLFDSSGQIHKKIDFFTEKEKTGTVNNTEPAVVKGNSVFVGVKTVLSEKSLGAHKKWCPLYKIDLETGQKEMAYKLPDIYHKDLYGYPYMDYSYCINDKGNFIFSFAADTSIYETDINTFNISYNAQSRFHKGAIPSLSRDEISGPGTYKIYSLRDSYGPIIYDPFRNIYMRQAKQGMSEAEFDSKKGFKKRTIILLDSSFKIFGEVETNNEFSFSSMFFSSDGRPYVRVNSLDEQALHFTDIRFEFETHSKEVALIPKNK